MKPHAVDSRDLAQPTLAQWRCSTLGTRLCEDVDCGEMNLNQEPLWEAMQRQQLGSAIIADKAPVTSLCLLRCSVAEDFQTASTSSAVIDDMILLSGAGPSAFSRVEWVTCLSSSDVQLVPQRTVARSLAGLHDCNDAAVRPWQNLSRSMPQNRPEGA